jgi:hypothetical protein
MKYQLREKMFAIGDDYWIETDGGQPAFTVDGKGAPHSQDAQSGMEIERDRKTVCIDQMSHNVAG